MMRRLYIVIQLGACLGFASNTALAASYDHRLTSVLTFHDFSSSEAAPVDENKFTLYISQGILTIKYEKPIELVNGDVIVYNLLGQEITRKKLENANVNQITIPLQNTCYLVRINYSGKVHTQKVMISAQ